MIDINDKFNVCSIIATIMSDILKTIYMKQYVLDGYHSFVKSRQRIIIF